MTRLAGSLRLAAAILVAVIGIAGISLGITTWQERDGDAAEPALESAGSVTATVARIIDGDTIAVTLREHDGEVKVRLLNIDTPEQGECLYAEATSHLAGLLSPGEDVTLVYDVERADRYGRDLAGVVKQNGTFINEAMVADGFARAVEYQPNTAFSQQMRAAEARAEAAVLGIHSVPASCLMPTRVSRTALDRYEADRDPFYLDVMRESVERAPNFTYREQALRFINTL
ncbi:thermonuclease family protein [Corynebacterium bouchesdurhonense]|uniref:thermonuclease family protein n=1 Tax=Corynebacterium bouchesdurhonense TaxID=1720192 RepID=UPI0008378869|nr:thermonuclease family protein [Corynebacterium bouchesdurhonense]